MQISEMHGTGRFKLNYKYTQGCRFCENKKFENKNLIYLFFSLRPGLRREGLNIIDPYNRKM